MTNVHYLDANATQPLRPCARQAMLAAFETVGNPSSVHRAGRDAHRTMEDAREAIALMFGGRPQDLIFTSGGTEADATAVHAMSRGRRILISAIEHDAIRSLAADRSGGAAASIETATVAATSVRTADIVPVLADGVLDLAALEQRLSDGVASLVCLMLANNETGVIQPVSEAAAICRRHGALLHVDAVQAAGRMPVRLDRFGAHSLAVSSHKLGGPAGVGALLLAQDAPFAEPLITGGGQERGRRGGTQALALIAGFAAAARASAADDLDRIRALRDAAERAALACGAVVCGNTARRLPNTTCIALPGAASGVQVIALDLEGIAISAGSACSSGKVTRSHVLHAMGLGPLAGEAIRVSLPWNVTEGDIDAFAEAYRRVAARFHPAPAPPVTPPLAPRAA
ncbi:MAG TPA: aminotransferase class V-fold PLP-dependent enzyme [Rhodopila sp.]